jgi:DNA-binding Lrp family transcriptional regulator
MAEAYVLVNCELGAEEEVIGGLKQIEQVKEVHGTFGAYDIIARVQAESADKLREAITWQIRKMNKIRSTLTLTVVEGQGE